MRLVYWLCVVFASAALQAQTGNPIPVINPGGVVSAQAFGAFPTFAPGSWIEIYGSNLSGTARTWQGSDFQGNSAPTVLDGVRVMIGSQFAFIDYVSSGQINAQVPNGIGSGTVQLTVLTATGTSAPYPITANKVQPELYAPPSLKISGRQYVAAIFPDGAYALPQGANAGVPSRPAKPGDTIVMYGIGFGPVTPTDIPPGQIAKSDNRVESLKIVFANSNGQIVYGGLAPNFVGLYQFNVVVPLVANSDAVAVSFFTTDGTPANQLLYIPIQQ